MFEGFILFNLLPLQFYLVLWKQSLISDSQQFHHNQQTNNHLSAQIIKFKKEHGIGNPGPDLWQTLICGGLKQFIRSQSSPSW